MIRVERIGMARIFTNLIDRTELIDSNESIVLFGSTSVTIKGRFFEMGTYKAGHSSPAGWTAGNVDTSTSSKRA